MRISRTVCLLGAVLAASIVPTTPAGALAVYSYCEESFTTEGSCGLPLTGLGFHVYGEATAASGCCGYVEVRVIDPLGNVLFGCRADSGNADTHPPAIAKCDAEGVALAGSGIAQLGTGVPLTCEVSGKGSGTYHCLNYTT